MVLVPCLGHLHLSGSTTGLPASAQTPVRPLPTLNLEGPTYLLHQVPPCSGGSLALTVTADGITVLNPGGTFKNYDARMSALKLVWSGVQALEIYKALLEGLGFMGV